jgi:hypothetical protein
LKGTVYEKCVYGGTILPKAYNIQALDLRYLEEKGHTVGSASISSILANLNLYSKQL